MQDVSEKMSETLRNSSAHPYKKTFMKKSSSFENSFLAKVKPPFLLWVNGRRSTLITCKYEMVKKENAYSKYRTD